MKEKDSIKTISREAKNTSIFIGDREYDLLENAILELQRKTGIYIDRYRVTKQVHPDHLKILIKSIEDDKVQELKEVIEFFESAVQKYESLCFIGD